MISRVHKLPVRARFHENLAKTYWTLVATASEDRTAGIWKVSSGSQQLVRFLHEDRVRDVALSPYGEYPAAFSSNRAEIWLWWAEDVISAFVPSLAEVVKEVCRPA